MEQKINEMVVNDVVYVRKDSVDVSQKAPDLDGMEYCIVRTYSAGVFAGYLDKREGKEVTLLNARRLWSWSGAASLSQLAMEGTKSPENCKFPCEVNSIDLTEAIEIIDCTEEARLSIAKVSTWEK